MTLAPLKILSLSALSLTLIAVPAPVSSGASQSKPVALLSSPPSPNVWLAGNRAVEASRTKMEIVLEAMIVNQKKKEVVQTVRSVRPTVQPSTPTSSPSGTEAFLACTRAHESDTAGGYSAVSPDGTYRGAYQFDQSTWDSVASSSGRPDLVGVNPASASPGDQDLLASTLYGMRGNQPWGGRC